MSLILTAPQRIAMMCLDASDHVTSAFDTFQLEIDIMARPCWIITDDSATYSPEAQDLVKFEERYRMEYVGEFFNAGMSDEYERITRQVITDTVRYFQAASQLQMRNRRNKEDAPLGPLPSVEWATITQRDKVALMTRGGTEQMFWGCVLQLTVQAMYYLDEILVGEE